MIDELPTYTYYWELQRKLWRILDVELPWPIGLQEAVSFGLVLALMVLGAWLLGFGLTWGDAPFFLLVPGAAAMFAGEHLELFDGRTAWRWAFSQLRWLVWEPKRLSRLQPARERGRRRIQGWTWQELGGDWMGES